jgi:hypothetical protein
VAWLHKARNPGLWAPGRQPSGTVRLADGARPYHLLWAPAQRDIAQGQAVTVTGTAPLSASALGAAWAFSSGPSVVSVPTVVPPGEWTIEAYCIISAGVQCIAGFNASADASSGTNDRQIRITSAHELYIYDNATVVASNSAPLVVGAAYHYAGVATASSATLWVNGVPGSPVGLSTTGYAGYTSVYFCGGYSGGGVVGGSSAPQIPWVAFHQRALSPAEIRARAASPFNIVQPEG